MLDLAKILQSCSQEIHEVLIKLQSSKKNGKFIEHCNKIKKHEREADHLYRKAIAELFETNDAVQILKNYEIHTALYTVNYKNTNLIQTNSFQKL